MRKHFISSIFSFSGTKKETASCIIRLELIPRKCQRNKYYSHHMQTYTKNLTLLPAITGYRVRLQYRIFFLWNSYLNLILIINLSDL